MLTIVTVVCMLLVVRMYSCILFATDCSGLWLTQQTQPLFEHGSKIRGVLGDVAENIWSPVAANVVKGIALGERDGLMYLQKLFRVTGLSHIAVFSGANMALVLVMMEMLFAFIKVPQRFVLLIIMALFVIVVVGPSPPAIRACIMATLALIGKLLNQKWGGYVLLLASGVVMILFVPSLIYSISFHLTMLASWGMIRMQGNADQELLLSLKEQAMSTTKISFFMLLYTLGVFGQWYVASLLANVVVLPTVGFVTTASLLLMLVGLVSETIATFFAWPVEILIRFWVFLMEYIANEIPYVIEDIRIPSLAILLVYIVFMLQDVRRHQRDSRNTSN